MKILLKPINRERLWRDFGVIQVAFALFGFAIAVVIRANLGATSWAVLEVGLSQNFGITPGTATVIVGAVVMFAALALREPIGWGTVANILSIGPWEDLFLWIVPPISTNLPLQILYLLTGLITMSLASAIYIGINSGAGPRDSLMLAIARTTPFNISMSRAVIEIMVVMVGWLLGGPLGIGTLIFALLIGPGVHLAFRLLGVDTSSRKLVN